MAETPFLDRLQEELEAWQRQGLVGAGQARRILAYYGLVPQEAEESRSEGRLSAIFGILGALLVGIGVILFVASNWQEMSRAQRMVLLLAALVAAYGIGYWLKHGRGDHARIGAAFIFLGSLIFGANVFLVAQIYQVRAGEPLILAFWAAGALFMAYAALSTASFLLGILAAGGWYLSHGFQGYEPLWLAAWAAGAFGIAYVAVLRPALDRAMGFAIFRMRMGQAMLVAYLAILAAVAWYGFQLADWQIGSLGSGAGYGLAAFLPYGLLFLGLGEVQRSFPRTRSLSGAFVQLGLIVTFLWLFVFSFAGFWENLGRSGGQSTGESARATLVQLTVSYVVFAVLALLLTIGAVWRSGLTRPSLVQGVGVLVLGASSLLVVFHPFTSPEPYAIVFNLTLFGGALWAVALGLWTRRESLINIGLVFFVFLVFSRYFDFFFTLMDRSLVFIGAGLLLLGGGYLIERYRRRLLREMRREASLDT